uniref:Uncharacterized protein n=1 Tax=Globodera rostochiensis TaxID=31243 RepID=A0A914GXJ3_GLORO
MGESFRPLISRAPLHFPEPFTGVSLHKIMQFHCFCRCNVSAPNAAVLLMFFALFLSTAVQIRSHILPQQSANEAGGGGTILLSRYGRAAVLSRYGKRDGGAERQEFSQGFGEGPWFLCKRTLDGQFLRCRSPLQRRKK